MKYLIIWFLSLWGFFAKTPEPKVFFNGIVKNQKTGDALVACEIWVRYPKTGINAKTLADTNGKFTLTLSPGEFNVTYKRVGYHSVKNSYAISSKKDTTISSIVLMKAKVSSDSNMILNHKGKLNEHDESADGFSEIFRPKVSEPVKKHKSAEPSSDVTVSDRKSIVMSSKVATRGHSDASSSSEGISGMRVKYESTGRGADIKAGTLTSGEINDFSKWVLWNDLSQGELKQYVSHWSILPKHRFSIQVTSESMIPLADILVVLKDPEGKEIWQSRTDNTGKAELWAGLYDSSELKKGKFTIEATRNGRTYTIKNAAVFNQKVNKLIIPVDCKQPLNMDIVFAVDATGSMGDEIHYLQAELYDVIEKLKSKNSGLNLNMGSVFYRDKGDEYLTVQQDLTSDISTVMSFIKAQSADGGGDEPEGVDAAMEVAISKFNWSNEARARIMFLVLDASPHRDSETLEKLKKYTQMAAEKGIRIVPIVCSGIDKSSEYLLRSIALATNGNYIFLTDHSGIGNSHIAPSTDKYDVETLNVLLIRLLQQYIYMPSCNQEINSGMIDTLQHNDKDSLVKDSTFVKNPNISKDSSDAKPDSWFLKYYPNPCRGILKVDINASISELYITDINGKLLMKITVSKEQGHLEIDLTDYAAGIYFLRYCVDGVCKSGKFILVR